MKKPEAKHIGIIACSAEGAALCYRSICLEGKELMGEHTHPEISLHCYNLAEYMECIYEEDWSGVAQLMRGSAEKLIASGAELLICPDNTIHQSFAEAGAGLEVQWLHIAQVVLAEAKHRGFETIALTGTQYLMEGPVYPDYAEKSGITLMTPPLKARSEISRIIFEELVYGEILPESERFFIETIAELKRQGCQAVILGCTEIPLMMHDGNSPLPTLDSTRLLAKAALRESLKTG